MNELNYSDHHLLHYSSFFHVFNILILQHVPLPLAQPFNVLDAAQLQIFVDLEQAYALQMITVKGTWFVTVLEQMERILLTIVVRMI